MFPEQFYLGRVYFSLEIDGKVEAHGPRAQQFNIHMNQYRIINAFPNLVLRRDAVTSTFVHELGHVLGLSHPTGIHQNANSVMQDGGSHERKIPTSFDLNSVRMLFE